MDNLDITTSHNIVVSVELANVTQRILATCIDGFIIGVYVTLVSLFAGGSQTAMLILITPVVLTYHLIMEYFFDGQSLGKKLLKLRVISLKGDRPDLLNLVLRWMFRIIDVGGSMGLLAMIFTFSSKKNQRLGDILANTTVVRVENDNFISLSSIKELNMDNYEVTYPLATMYRDSDMLLIKEAIARFQRRPNIDNRKLLAKISDRIHHDFKLKKDNSDHVSFLKRVLNDYIVLTR